jgi:hypothetical protein
VVAENATMNGNMMPPESSGGFTNGRSRGPPRCAAYRTIVGFQREEAKAFLHDLQERMRAIKKRMLKQLQAVKMELRRRMHDPIAKTGRG